MRSVVSLALGLLVLGCGEDPPPPAPPPGPPSADSLQTVDLCPDGDSAAFVRDHLRQGGTGGVVTWMRQNVQLPANVRYCGPVSGAEVHDVAIRLTVYRMIGATRSGVLYEQGPPLTELPLGMRTLSFDVFAEDGSGRDSEGVRILFHYHGS